MRTIARTAPRVDISIVRAERRELERELSAGTLDAAIDVLLPLPEALATLPFVGVNRTWS